MSSREDEIFQSELIGDFPQNIYERMRTKLDAISVIPSHVPESQNTPPASAKSNQFYERKEVEEEEEEEEEELYVETQVRLRCGVHALNNFLQKQKFIYGKDYGLNSDTLLWERRDGALVPFSKKDEHSLDLAMINIDFYCKNYETYNYGAIINYYSSLVSNPLEMTQTLINAYIAADVNKTVLSKQDKLLHPPCSAGANDNLSDFAMANLLVNFLGFKVMWHTISQRSEARQTQLGELDKLINNELTKPTFRGVIILKPGHYFTLIKHKNYPVGLVSIDSLYSKTVNKKEKPFLDPDIFGQTDNVGPDGQPMPGKQSVVFLIYDDSGDKKPLEQAPVMALPTANAPAPAKGPVVAPPPAIERNTQYNINVTEIDEERPIYTINGLANEYWLLHERSMYLLNKVNDKYVISTSKRRSADETKSYATVIQFSSNPVLFDDLVTDQYINGGKYVMMRANVPSQSDDIDAFIKTSLSYNQQIPNSISMYEFQVKDDHAYYWFQGLDNFFFKYLGVKKGDDGNIYHGYGIIDSESYETKSTKVNDKYERLIIVLKSPIYTDLQKSVAFKIDEILAINVNKKVMAFDEMIFSLEVDNHGPKLINFINDVNRTLVAIVDQIPPIVPMNISSAPSVAQLPPVAVVAKPAAEVPAPAAAAKALIIDKVYKTSNDVYYLGNPYRASFYFKNNVFVKVMHPTNKDLTANINIYKPRISKEMTAEIIRVSEPPTFVENSREENDVFFPNGIFGTITIKPITPIDARGVHVEKVAITDNRDKTYTISDQIIPSEIEAMHLNVNKYKGDHENVFIIPDNKGQSIRYILENTKLYLAEQDRGNTYKKKPIDTDFSPFVNNYTFYEFNSTPVFELKTTSGMTDIGILHGLKTKLNVKSNLGEHMCVNNVYHDAKHNVYHIENKDLKFIGEGNKLYEAKRTSNRTETSSGLEKNYINNLVKVWEFEEKPIHSPTPRNDDYDDFEPESTPGKLCGKVINRGYEKAPTKGGKQKTFKKPRNPKRSKGTRRRLHRK